MNILPVIDLMNRRVVRGVAGRRDDYQPLRSDLTVSTEPLAVARALREHFGLTTLYLADLDAIRHRQPCCDVYQMLLADQFDLLVDAGLREFEFGEWLSARGVCGVIAGLETCPGPTWLAELCRRLPPGAVVFSLDLLSGRVLGNSTPWKTIEPISIARQAVACGVERIIVLDLCQVGIPGGLVTTALCGQLRAEFPRLGIMSGGGVRGGGDLDEGARLGLDAVLVASALHDGRITRQEVARFTGCPT